MLTINTIVEILPYAEYRDKYKGCHGKIEK